MSLASSDNRQACHVVPFRGRPHEGAREQVSDCWPDFSSDLSGERLRASVRKNRIGRVLAEIVGAVAYSVGLVVLLMIIVDLAGKP